MNKKVTVRDLLAYFNYRQLCGDDNSLNREIHEANTNRPGLELAGYFEKHVYRRIVVIGEKEYNYIQLMSIERQQEAFDYLTDDNVPMILIARDLPCPNVLLEIAKKKNFPVFSSFAPTNSLIVEIISFLEEYFAPSDSIHGCLLQVFGRGILLIGSSGVGKSEIALELIKRGHILIADDRVDICRLHNDIVGESPDILKNLLEIRGVGIIDVTKMFGVSSTADKCKIDFVINLEKWNVDKDYDRIGIENNEEVTYFGIDLPKITLPVSEGRSIAVIIESAVTNYILRSKGINSALDFEDRVVSLCNMQKGE